MAQAEHRQALALGNRIQNLQIVRAMGVGGFGVTYLVEHVRLGHKAALKEYMPSLFAMREETTVRPTSDGDRENFEQGLRRFLDEAETLARFSHPNIVRVRDYFEENNTAYILMDYEEGESLDRLLDQHGTLSEAQLLEVLLPVVDGLKVVHRAGFLRKDVKWENICLRRSDESPVLLDLGSARQAFGNKSHTMSAMVSIGYSPPEQYESRME